MTGALLTLTGGVHSAAAQGRSSAPGLCLEGGEPLRHVSEVLRASWPELTWSSAWSDAVWASFDVSSFDRAGFYGADIDGADIGRIGFDRGDPAAALERSAAIGETDGSKVDPDPRAARAGAASASETGATAASSEPLAGDGAEFPRLGGGVRVRDGHRGSDGQRGRLPWCLGPDDPRCQPIHHDGAPSGAFFVGGEHGTATAGRPALPLPSLAAVAQPAPSIVDGDRAGVRRRLDRPPR